MAKTNHSKFEMLHLKENLLYGISEIGFTKPTSIQKRGIPPCINAQNVILEGHAGSGKTVGLAIAILECIDPTNRYCQALLLVSTRKEATKTAEIINFLGKFMNVTCQASIGGTDVRQNILEVFEGVQIVVGTPGRILDLLYRKKPLLNSFHNQIRMIIVDGTESLLLTNFQPTMVDIFKHLNPNPQIIFSCEDASPALLEATREIVKNPLVIKAKAKKNPLKGIQHYYLNSKSEEAKLQEFFNVYQEFPIATQAVIFCNHRKMVDRLFHLMQKKGHCVTAIHNSKNEDAAKVILKEFHSGVSRVLIATDVYPCCASDTKKLSLVINFDLPADFETYRQRIGGTEAGQFARESHRVVINFVTNGDIKALNEFQDQLPYPIRKFPSNVAEMFQT